MKRLSAFISTLVSKEFATPMCTNAIVNRLISRILIVFSVWAACVRKNFSNGYDSLCYKIGYSLIFRQKRDMLLIIFKALKNNMPQYIQSFFDVRENKKNLRGKNKPVLLVAKTTTYGCKSTSLHFC